VKAPVPQGPRIKYRGADREKRSDAGMREAVLSCEAKRKRKRRRWKGRAAGKCKMGKMLCGCVPV